MLPRQVKQVSRPAQTHAMLVLLPLRGANVSFGIPVGYGIGMSTPYHL